MFRVLFGLRVIVTLSSLFFLIFVGSEYRDINILISQIMNSAGILVCCPYSVRPIREDVLYRYLPRTGQHLLQPN